MGYVSELRGGVSLEFPKCQKKDVYNVWGSKKGQNVVKAKIA